MLSPTKSAATGKILLIGNLILFTLQFLLHKSYCNNFRYSHGGISIQNLVPILASDIIETEKQYKVHVDLPGVRQSDLKLNIINGRLHIEAARQKSHEENNNYFHHIERSYGVVSRVIPIPSHANIDTIKANFAHGVLDVTFDKLDKPDSHTQVHPVLIHSVP